MKILGIDLAKNSTGFVVVGVNDKTSEISVEKIGTTDTTSKDNWGEQYRIIYEQMLYLKKKYTPDVVLIERPFMMHGKSTMAIFGALGVVRMAFEGDEIELISANTIKKYIAGHGHAKKGLVEKKLSSWFPEVQFRNNDESDALGVVITHLIREGIYSGWDYEKGF